ARAQARGGGPATPRERAGAARPDAIDTAPGPDAVGAAPEREVTPGPGAVDTPVAAESPEGAILRR
ncbi:hypothetical protein ACWGDD_12665, partial [Streptomyces sp. NPDC055011]